jgi:2-polyprenyl-6-methoxyphenol hydroxylase-like FAD-dependent oxidoreductase
MRAKAITTRCCVVGGGPAGMMLGFLLARAGIPVVVLEKHADFFRDFRGDTIHPSTLELMVELGLIEEFLQLPHDQLGELAGIIGEEKLTLADFSALPVTCPFIAMMPQWDFLNFLAEKAKRYPHFRLIMQAEATDLIFDGERVAGVKAQTPEGEIEICADLTVAADGRHSIIRERAGLTVKDLGASMDVLWMRLSKKPTDAGQTLGRFAAGRLFITIDRGDYWQCAYVIPKGGIEEVKRQGLPAFRQAIASLNPDFTSRVNELKDWDDIKLLTVKVDRLKTWYRPGLLVIGDAAHAMSPVGGVGVNLAIQDAVAAANILWEPLARGYVPTFTLAKVQRRRAWPTRLLQRLQIFVQRRIIGTVLRLTRAPRPPLVARLLNRYPYLRRLPARLVGLGPRPEHIETPEAP